MSRARHHRLFRCDAMLLSFTARSECVRYALIAQSWVSRRVPVTYAETLGRSYAADGASRSAAAELGANRGNTRDQSRQGLRRRTTRRPAARELAARADAVPCA